MENVINVALLFGMAIGYSRGVLRGVRTYAKPRMPWRFYNRPPTIQDLEYLLTYKPAGVLAHAVNPVLAGTLANLNIPVVNVSTMIEEARLPRVGVDDIAVGELAARYYMERGFKHFAYIGFPKHHYSRLRNKGFQKTLNDAGLDCFLYDFNELPQNSQSWDAMSEEIRRWIRLLPKPVGIFACNDDRAWTLCEICYGSGLHVPEEISILGVDDDEFICELAHPTLSSVRLPTERIGYEAAALLAQLMAGQPAPTRELLLPPTGIVTRQSSDILAIHDADVVAAVRFIRDHAAKPMTVEDVLKQVPLSRRTLERKFQSELQRTPLDEIRRVHIERAKHLLVSSDLSISAVAEESGYHGPERFSAAFKEEIGLSPRDFRKRYRMQK